LQPGFFKFSWVLGAAVAALFALFNSTSDRMGRLEAHIPFWIGTT
jgi:hypothetical protein